MPFVAKECHEITHVKMIIEATGTPKKIAESPLKSGKSFDLFSKIVKAREDIVVAIPHCTKTLGSETVNLAQT